MKIQGLDGVGSRLRAGFLLAVLAWFRAGAADLEPPVEAAPPLPPAVILMQAPAPGSRFTAPGPVLIEAQATDPAGDIRHLDFYANDTLIGVSDFLSKIAVIPGQVIPHRLEWTGVEPGAYKIVARAKDTLGNPVESRAIDIEVVAHAEPRRVVFVPAGSVWRYLADGTDLKEAWRAPGFEDAKWPSGPAQLGYGDGDEKTVIRTEKPPHPITAYFRSEFQVPADAAYSRLTLRMVRDDGAVVYLNGEEIVRDNLPEGTILFSTPASDTTDAENVFRSYLLDPAVLVAGRNVLAVEVHQAGATSSDVSFDLELVGVLRDSGTPPAVVGVEATRPATSEPMPNARIAPAQFTVRRTGSTAWPLPVVMKWSGTATSGRDYEPLPNLLVIPAGKAEVALDVPALDDDLIEGVETVVAEVVQPPGISFPIRLPLVEDLLPWLEYAIDPDHARAEATIQDADLPTVARVIIDSPEAGSRFPEGEPISISAVAVDPKGYINRVEFFAGDTAIGISEIQFIRAPDPGTPIRHEIEWKGAPAGTHKLIARAVSSVGTKVESEGVPIVVMGTGDQVVLELGAADEVATEPASGTGRDVGVLVVRRAAGRKDVAVPIWYTVSGTAANGTDYVRLTGRAELARGAEVVEIVVRPLADRLAEGDETVEVKLANPVCAEIFPPLPQCYRIGNQAAARVVVKDHSVIPATLTVKEPVAGQAFEFGATIPVLAVAVDPRGYISRVEFYDGEQRIGVSELTFIKAPEPGTPIEHHLEWKGAAVGEHKIIARAKGTDGEAVVSPGVVVRVNPRPVTGKLAITTPKSGTTLSAGISVPVTVEAVDEKGGISRVELFDGTKSVGVSEIVFVQPPEPGVPIVHTIAWKEPTVGGHTLTARALDTGGNRIVSPAVTVVVKANLAPRVAVTSPSHGTVFLKGETIVVRAEASDADGTVDRLDLLAGDRLLGSSKEPKLTFEWKDASIGLHKLTARAVDNLGKETRSSAVTIYVRDPADLAFVRRDLPPAYLPGAGVEVVLVAEPPRSAKAWTVEDALPAGWTAVEISDEGAFDAARGKVKFGPFTDTRERRLAYLAVAPASAAGAQKFAGSSSVDGKSYPVIGEDTLLPAGEYHPADATPKDKSISADEVTAYAAAWKVGTGWGEDPSPIPLSYVTRAGQIWKQGEAYVFDPAKGAPPACWAPATARSGAVAGLAAANGGRGTVERKAPVIWKPGRTGEVTLTVTPPVGTSATAVEELVPAGWSVTSVGAGGRYDGNSGRLRWGIVYGAKAFEVTYELAPPRDAASTVELRGWASFDGSQIAITGRRRAGAADETTELRIAGSRRDEHGMVHLRVESPAEQVFAVEASSDLVNWTELGAFVQTGDELPVNDPAAAEGRGQRYYRLRPVGR